MAWRRGPARRTGSDPDRYDRHPLDRRTRRSHTPGYRRPRGRAAPPRFRGPPAPPGTRAGYGRRPYGWSFRGPQPREWRDVRDAGNGFGWQEREPRRARQRGHELRRPERRLHEPRGTERRRRRYLRHTGRGGYGRADTRRRGRAGGGASYGAWYGSLPYGGPYYGDAGRIAYDAAEPEGRGERRRRGGIDRRSARERRSGIDRRTGEVQGAGWIQRGREVLARFREPIIGLTVAAAAAPIARQQGTQTSTAKTPTGQAAPQQAAATAPEADLEERVGSRWAAAEEDRARADTIEGAIVRYGITRDLAEDIYDAAVAEGIEPDIAFGLVNTESAFNPRAVSSVGARGLTQLMPATARWLQPGLSNEDIFERQTNLRLGFSYLDQLIGQYDGDLRLALLAYNRGPGTVDGVLARGGNPDNGYADMVLSG